MKRRQRPYDPMFSIQDDLSIDSIVSGKQLVPIEVEVVAGGHHRGAFIGDLKAQIKYVLRNLQTAVEAYDATLADIFQLRVYLEKSVADQTDEINTRIDKFFDNAHPTVVFIPVTDITNSDFLIELEVLLLLDQSQIDQYFFEIDLRRAIDDAKSDDIQVRGQAFTALYKLPQIPFTHVLVTLLQHSDTAMRQRVIRLLAKTNHPRAVQVLIEAMQRDAAAHLRPQYANALADLGSDILPAASYGASEVVEPASS